MKQLQIISVLALLVILQAVANQTKTTPVTHLNAFNKEHKTMTNLDIIKSTYEGENSKENSKNLKRYMTDETLWTEAAGFPYAGTYQGFDEIEEQVFARLASEWIDYNFTVQDYVASGDKVFAYGTYSGIYKATGKNFKARVAHLWKLKEGKIIHFEQFVDSKTVWDAM